MRAHGVVLVLVLVLLGCGGGGGSTDAGRGDGGSADAPVDAIACTPRVAETAIIPAAIDVLLAVDTSGSMDLEIGEVQAHINDFATAFGPETDLQVTLIADPSVCVPAPLGSGSCPADENLPGYRHVVQMVGSNNALDLILSTAPAWRPSFRTHVPPAVIVVTDDDAELSASAFEAQFEALQLSFIGFDFYAIAAASSPDTCVTCQLACATCTNACCNQSSGICEPIAADEGVVYQQLAAATNGLFFDQCAQQFGPFFAEMATAIVERTPRTCRYPIPPDPSGAPIDPARIDVSYGPGAPTTPVPHASGLDCFAGGWHLDEELPPTSIILCGTLCDTVEDDPANVVFIEYGCPGS